MTDTEHDRNSRRGLWLGLASAVGYSGANIALRGLSGRHDDLTWSIWVSAMKAVPTLLMALVLLFAHRSAQRSPLVPRRVFLPLMAAALVMQFGGNLGFQVAIGMIGLAITVPLVFALIIVSGAVLGRLFLEDAVSLRTAASIVIMTISIALLSHAASQNAEQPEATSGKATETRTGEDAPAVATANSTDSVTVEDDSSIVWTPQLAVWLGVLVAVVSGTAYGINGAVIRGVVRNTISIEAMLLVYSTTGVVCLGGIGAFRMGVSRLTAIQADEWMMMAVAGVLNALAFYCITHALKLMNITRVNVINASQNAMCAIAAVVLFHEPQTLSLSLGIGLSIVGLIVLGRR
ncbi:MAG: DMT family transporter [Planctomycetaceae bacterium]|nr:DMT family transporter [Planctomycetaceae bacterium]